MSWYAFSYMVNNKLIFLFIWNTAILVFFILFVLIEVYEASSLPEAVDLIVGSLQVTKSFKNNITDNRTIPRALTGAHEFISTQSFESLELTLQTVQRLCTILRGFWVQKYRYAESDDASYWTLSCNNSFEDPFNESTAVFKRVYDVHHWVSKKSLRMISPLFYK